MLLRASSVSKYGGRRRGGGTTAAAAWGTQVMLGRHAGLSALHCVCKSAVAAAGALELAPWKQPGPSARRRRRGKAGGCKRP